VYAFVENSGRLDQIMANIQTLFLGREYIGDIPIYLISTDCVSCLLPPGHHKIRLPDFNLKGLHCGLIPMDGTAVISTKGLKWNLENEELKFGALVSTSNAFGEHEVHVETDNSLLWTMDLVKQQFE